ncbi:MAG TPA: 16S rRNA (cytosine(967)-C(5))-methyltransferase RsmB [Verrucomicrobiae bacterium]|nr:16S rRNA (cytosine(967)-C(5))-methyltransferase RsmB [Verrucomicrobiae bacterium]
MTDNIGIARVLALDALEKVTEQGAYANLILQQSLADKGLSGPDRGLATELVYGILKQRLLLDWHLQSFLSKPISTLPPKLQHILRIGAYQLLFLDRVPPRAAINDAVNQAKRAGFAGLGGMVNAVLRNLERNKTELGLPEREKEPAKYLSIAHSHPQWMVERWLKRYGLDGAEELCRINNQPAPTWLRTNILRIDREELAELLRAEGVEVIPGRKAPESLEIRNFSAVEKLTPFQQGLCTVQDESSMLVAHVLGARPGETVVDTCSAPGGKTTHIAQLMGNQGIVKAFEIHPHKLQLVEGACRRLGLDCVQVIQGDARELGSLLAERADRVLVDAPCSGLGVLRRKPDARWKKHQEDIGELKKLQLQILKEAANLVKPGGTLVYSTCTIEPEENFEVIKEFRKAYPDFAPVDMADVLPFELEREEDLHMAKKGYIQFLPHIHNMDGFFIARMDRIV